MAPRNTYQVKFTADGLQEVLKASQQVSRSYVDWLESAEKAIKDTDDLLDRHSKNVRQDADAIAKIERDRTKAARDANRAIEASYRELGIKSGRSIEEQKNKAISAYEALKKSGVASTDDLARAAAALERKLEGLEGQLDKVGDEAKDAGGGFTILKGSIAGVVANLATDVFRNAISGLVNLGKGAIATRTQFSKLRDQIALIEGGDVQGEKVFAKLQEFNAQTPFELEEVTQAYIQLGNRGIKPTNEQLTKLGDLALSQGKSLGQLIEAVLDAQTGENERLKEFGIRASKDGDRVKFAFKGITKEVELTEQAVLDTLVSFGAVDGIAGNIEKASNRLDGVGSNIADTFSGLGDTIGGVFEPLLVSGGKFLVEVLGPITNPQLWAPLGDALKALGEAIAAAVPGADSLADSFSSGVAGAVEIVAGFIFGIAEILQQYPGIISSFLDLFGSVAELLSGGISPSVAIILKSLEGWLLIQQLIWSGLNFSLEGWLLVDEAVSAVGDGVSILATLISTTVQNAILDLRIAWEQIKDYAASVWQYIKDQWAIAAEDIRDQINSFIQWWENVKAKAVETWNAIKQWAESAIASIIGKVQDLLKPFDQIKSIGADIGKNILGWADPIKKAAGLLDNFKNGFLKILGLSKDVGTDVGKKLEETGTGGPLLPAPEGSFHPKKFPITSPFGMRNGRLHAGTDYGTPQGTPLGNIFGAGTVTIAGPVGAYGNLIELTLDNGDVYRFGHMSRIHVRAGQRVPPGALLGLTGGEPGTAGAGRSTGPHLHLEYYPGGGGAIDFQSTGRGGPTLANNISPFSRHICGPYCKEHGIKKTRGKGGPTPKVKAKPAKKDEPKKVKVTIGGIKQEIEIVEKKEIGSIEIESELKAAREAMEKALEAFGLETETKREEMEREITSRYEKILDALNESIEKYERIIKVKAALKEASEAETKEMGEAIALREKALAQRDAEIAKIGELLKLKEQLTEAERLDQLAALESEIILGQADNARRTGQISEFEAQRMATERRIVEQQAAHARQLAELRSDRAQASTPEQAAHIDTLIQKYEELNNVKLDALRIELDEIAQAQADAARILPSSKELASTIVGGLREIPGLIRDVLSGAKSFGDAILSIIGGIAQRLSDLLFDKAFAALEGILDGLFSGGGGRRRGGGGLLGTLLGAGIGAATGAIGGGGGTATALNFDAAPIFAARGTVLPGYGGGDRRLAFLEDGEAVLRKELVRAVDPARIALANQMLSPEALLSPSAISAIQSAPTPMGGGSNIRNTSNDIDIHYHGAGDNRMRPSQRQLTNDLTTSLQRYGR